MNIPNSYSPLETMERLLPAVAKSLGLSNEDLISVMSQELLPQLLSQTSLDRMQSLYQDLESNYAMQSKV